MFFGESYPREVVDELDKYIIGQQKAKSSSYCAQKSLSAQNLPEEMREEIYPKNIIMIGSTGVGKPRLPGAWLVWLKLLS